MRQLKYDEFLNKVEQFVKDVNEKYEHKGIEVMFNENNELFYISFKNGDEHIRDTIMGVLDEIEEYR